MAFQKITTRELDEIIIKAKDDAGVSETEMFDRFLVSIRDHLRNNPFRYRAYGPYWWPLKHEIIEAGYDDFGEHLDRQWLEDAGYGTREYNLSAAYAYADMKIDKGLQVDSYHVLLDEEGNEFEFISQDSEMEAIGSTGGF